MRWRSARIFGVVQPIQSIFGEVRGVEDKRAGEQGESYKRFSHVAMAELVRGRTRDQAASYSLIYTLGGRTQDQAASYSFIYTLGASSMGAMQIDF